MKCGFKNDKPHKAYRFDQNNLSALLSEVNEHRNGPQYMVW